MAGVLAPFWNWDFPFNNRIINHPILKLLYQFIHTFILIVKNEYLCTTYCALASYYV
jgi:hypothetical protein